MKRFKAWFQSPIHIMMPLVLAVVLVMGTLAYFTDVEAAVNTIRFGEVSIETNEKLEGIEKHNIGVTAQGTSDCFVRIRVDVPTVRYTYSDENGIVVTKQAKVVLLDGTTLSADAWLTYSETIEVQMNGVDYIWEKNPDDGFWYLNRQLSRGEQVPFIDKITYEDLYVVENGIRVLADGITEDMLSIPIISEAVQADNLVEDLKAEGKTGYDLAVAAFQRVADGYTGTSGN